METPPLILNRLPMVYWIVSMYSLVNYFIYSFINMFKEVYNFIFNKLNLMIILLFKYKMVMETLF